MGGVREPVRLRLCGMHNVRNAVGAAAMAHAFGADMAAIRTGLEAVRPAAMRMQVERWNGIGIINDAYNANPASMEAALAALKAIPGRGRRVAVLGDMRRWAPTRPPAIARSARPRRRVGWTLSTCWVASPGTPGRERWRRAWSGPPCGWRGATGLWEEICGLSFARATGSSSRARGERPWKRCSRP